MTFIMWNGHQTGKAAPTASFYSQGGSVQAAVRTAGLMVN